MFHWKSCSNKFWHLQISVTIFTVPILCLFLSIIPHYHLSSKSNRFLKVIVQHFQNLVSYFFCSTIFYCFPSCNILKILNKKIPLTYLLRNQTFNLFFYSKYLKSRLMYLFEYLHSKYRRLELSICYLD